MSYLNLSAKVPPEKGGDPRVFYNVETTERLTWLDKLRANDRIFVGKNRLYRAFKKARETTGLDITPQRLRDWFCEEWET